MKNPIILAAGCLAATLAIPAFADDIDDTIKARQGYYKLIGHNAGVLFGMAKGDIPYDSEKAANHAGNLQTLSQLNAGSLFPAGSSKTDRPGKTRALPVIWSTFPAIGEKAQGFGEATSKIAVSAGLGLDALRADIGTLGAACKACHDTYRAKDF